MPIVRSSVLLDANVLLLWLVGRTDASLFANYKRVQIFDVRDYLLLKNLLRGPKNLLTTPHILAEVSNFLDQAPTYRRLALQSSFIEYVHASDERFVHAQDLTSRAEFYALGLTDTAVLSQAGEATVITTDFQLHGRILANGGDSLQFTQFRLTQMG